MKRALILLVLLAGCPGMFHPAGGGVSQGFGALAPPGPPPPAIELPKVGEVYSFELLGGGTREDTITAVDTSARTVTLSRVVRIAAAKPPASKYVEPLDGPSPAAQIKDDSKYEKAREETLTISGRAFPCEVRKIAVGSQTVEEWVSPRWPHVLKTTSGPFTSLELSSIEEKR